MRRNLFNLFYRNPYAKFIQKHPFLEDLTLTIFLIEFFLLMSYNLFLGTLSTLKTSALILMITGFHYIYCNLCVFYD